MVGLPENVNLSLSSRFLNHHFNNVMKGVSKALPVLRNCNNDT